MNKRLLKSLYKLHSPSGGEKKMRKFLKRQARLCGATEITQDILGNLFITKGSAETYPCLAAHMDQVQRTHSRDFTCIDDQGVIFGYSPKCHEQQGLGADDKNGIFVCLECLRRYDNIKVAFFVGEEVGCTGSTSCDLAFFADCRFIIEPDRRGSSDLITSMFCGDVCSEDFVRAIGAGKFGYKEDEGSVTDVGTLVERGVGISCLNLSCGYYEPHTDNEFTVLSELENCFAFVCHIIENCTDVYPYVYQGWHSSYGRWSSGTYSYVDNWMHDQAYEMFDMVLAENPDTPFEEAVLYLDAGIQSHISETDLRELYEDARAYYVPDDDKYGEIVFPDDDFSSFCWEKYLGK